MGAQDDELRGLRARAYGPNADISHDPRAQMRLQELEGVGRRPVPQHLDGVMPPVRMIEPVDTPGSKQDSHLVEDEQERPTHEVWRLAARFALAIGRRLAHVRRSTVLTSLGLAVTVSVIVSALILIERVQSDPLQTGATQFARLSIDPGYSVPSIFENFGTDERPILAFQEFYGLRAVVANRGWIMGGAQGECLNVFLASDGENSGSNSFSGEIKASCAAGPFPAMTQFETDEEGLPEELRSAFPGSTALQLVYDSENEEIVIFAGE